MTRAIIVISLILFFSCNGNKNKYVMDCQIEKVTVLDNDKSLEISDSITIRRITDLISKRERDLVKFKPRYWVEIIGPGCYLKFGVQKNLLKIDGLSYVLKEDLEEYISQSLHK